MYMHFQIQISCPLSLLLKWFAAKMFRKTDFLFLRFQVSARFRPQMKLYILLDKVGHNPEFESLQKALIRSITGLPKSALMQYNTFASKFSSDKTNSTAKKEKTAAKKKLQILVGQFQRSLNVGTIYNTTLGCPKMHQLLKSHAPQAKSNGNHPTELAKSNKSPMG